MAKELMTARRKERIGNLNLTIGVISTALAIVVMSVNLNNMMRNAARQEASEPPIEYYMEQVKVY